MPLCIDSYKEIDTYLSDKDILIRKRICQIYMVGDGERIPQGRGLVSYIIMKREADCLKVAYVKLGNAPVGYFTTTPKQGIYVEKIPLPKPFQWKSNQERITLEMLINCNISKKIKNEFDIDINKYLQSSINT